MIHKKVGSALLLLVSSAPCAFPQMSVPFEVASVKAVDISTLGDAINMNIGTVGHEEVTFGNATLNDCIRFAFDIGSDGQIEGPDWIKSKRYLYNIDAKARPGTSREQLQGMMQTLLSERFRLVTHRSQKEMSYYALIAVKSGGKMTAVKDVPDDFHGRTLGGHISSILPMSGLAYLLSRFETEQPIVDMTGLAGIYEIKLDWFWHSLQNADAETAGPSLFTALEEQLGLKLEARKGAVGILVVDSAEKTPAAN